MATAPTQISATISAETRQLMEEYVRRHGVKKSHLIESALLHHLQALDEIPLDLLIPPVLELTRASGERVLDRIDHPAPPTAAMQALFDA